jgi:hypothetical protein
MVFQFLKNTFRKLLIYQFVFFSILIRYQDLPLYANEFKDKINTNLSFFDFNNPHLQDLLADPESFLKYFLIAEVFFALLAFLGSKAASFVTASLTSLITFLYFNPLIQENRIKGLYEIRTEFLLSIGVILAIFLDSFSSSSAQEEANVETVEVEAEEQLQHQKKPVNKKQKKK